MIRVIDVVENVICEGKLKFFKGEKKVKFYFTSKA